MAPPLLSIRDLHITFAQPRPAVEKIDLDVHAGEMLALVGESGSGKSMTARAAIGLLPPGATATGSVKFHGLELLGAQESVLDAHRGRSIALVFQDPQSALNPVKRIGWQIGEAIRAHRSAPSLEVEEHAIELLTQVELPDPASLVGKYPHQLSGGQKQRVAIALALANDPELLIADEPTTALDVTVQEEILSLLRSISSRRGTGVLLITHNMGVVAQYADRVAVLREGRVLETDTTAALFTDPQHPYTRQLLDAVPTLDRTAPAGPGAAASESDIHLTVENVAVTYPAAGGTPPFQALRGVTLSVRRGEVLGVVGESGSGKTTLGRVVTGLIAPGTGMVRLDGRDLHGLSRGELRRLRRELAFIPQDPAASLNPRRTIADSIREPLDVHRIGDRAARGRRVTELLHAVSLPVSFARRYPDELSGGQRQRVAIARALALTPRLIVADEPTSALDVSVQAEVIDLFRRLQAELGFAAIFISHDLAVIGQVADKVAVLRHGEILEYDDTSTVYGSPTTDYTRRLLDAVPAPRLPALALT
ncbi:dipeptide ABC transporter ATP-binding protein [Corynebacterium comes]|uniref:Glutathione import ATP-binding protein GsiA n=1 Tax=Corynebacterium comes TaxID=2675218 RepID=A0A6B8VZW3_9CORY|nr:ABC transporter ATP-binding protein [Corynebacterium comes]QGU04605.1 Glutathione import ATP-binding protein GsiA [Corynebacterium comes]